MKLDLPGKTVAITGAGGGLGVVQRGRNSAGDAVGACAGWGHGSSVLNRASRCVYSWLFRVR